MGKYICFISLGFSLLCACSKSPSLIYFEDPPAAPVFSSEDLQCIELDSTENIRDNVVEAANLYPENSEFVLWLQKLEQWDPHVYLSLSQVGNGHSTLFLPSNEVWSKFLEAHPIEAQSEEKMRRLLNHHILLDWMGFEDMLNGSRTAHTANLDEFTYWATTQNCVFVGDSARVLHADDVCVNGVIHSIDKVMIPPGGL